VTPLKKGWLGKSDLEGDIESDFDLSTTYPQSYPQLLQTEDQDISYRNEISD